MAFDPDAPRHWDPKSQETAARLLEKMRDGEYRLWYCNRGRTCDGKPHEGVPYSHARSDQWPPPGSDWFLWFILSGRGSGKTRTGAEWLRKMSPRVERMAMVGRRGPDIRDTLVEGESGLIAVCEKAGVGYTWEPSKKLFTFANGSKAFGYSAEEPDTLRGPQHGIAWLDEPAHYALIDDVWDNLLFGLRLDYGLPGGAKVLATSTPLPVPWVKARMKEDDTRVVRVSTYANIANLDPKFRERLLARYEGTRTGRQELHGEILEDVEGAMWDALMLDTDRYDALPELDRVVVAVDPAGTATKRSDETGIVVLGKAGTEIYILADYSGKYSPQGWAQKVAWAYRHHQADRVIAETNYGGDMVRMTLESVDEYLPISTVNSRRGKKLRADPVVARYEQHHFHHPRIKHLNEWLVGDKGETLEDQMCTWVPGESDSPDRVDALVHGATELIGVNYDSGLAIPGGSRVTDPVSEMLRGMSTSGITSL